MYKRQLLRDAGIAFNEVPAVGTVVYAAANGVYLGCAVFADELKPDSADAIRDLASLGIADTTMLTGDKRAIAERVAKEVGISAVKPELLPADKVEEATALIRSCMEAQPFPEFDVPIVAEAAFGPSFGELAEMEVAR